ncbi:MAG: succinylglutamate desuccinylase/aspartoacylase family protein, partial [Gammaproteobacteria bacterium]
MSERGIVIGGVRIEPGGRQTVHLPVADLYTRNPVTMPVHVVRGRRAGPTLFVSAAVHGDELNGIEIIRRLLTRPRLQQLRGTLLAVPMVNVLGVLHQSRYLPDRRDLNRSFPGSERGSLAARLANLLIREVVSKSTHGIDLHTAAVHRTNLPQIRCQLEDEETARLAMSFGAPVVLGADLRDGSLRATASEHGVKSLLYEAGEALRFDETAIRAGVRGILNVMREIDMLPQGRRRRPAPSVQVTESVWVRAAGSGLLRYAVPIGASVRKGQQLARVADPFGEA